MEFVFVKEDCGGVNRGEMKELLKYGCKCGSLFYNKGDRFVKGGGVEFGFLVEVDGLWGGFYWGEGGC